MFQLMISRMLCHQVLDQVASQLLYSYFELASSQDCRLRLSDFGGVINSQPGLIWA